MGRRRINRERRGGSLPPIPLTPPAEYEMNGLAAREWRRIARLMRDAGVGTALDVGVLAAYCFAVARLVEAERRIAEAHLVRKDKRGAERRHPLVMVARAAGQDVARLATELGLSPAARLRVSYDAQGQADPWDALMEEVRDGGD